MKIFKVQDREFSKLISKYCDLTYGPWVAGGSVRKVFQGLPWKSQDIDFFFSSTNQYHALKNRINEFGKVSRYTHETQNAITYTVDTTSFVSKNESVYNVFDDRKDRSTFKKLSFTTSEDTSSWQKIQLIKKKYFASAEDVINGFDFGLAQFITDGNVILASNQALQDCKDNIIRINSIHTSPIPPNRIIKYASYGFNPDYKMLKTTVKSILSGDVVQNEDY